MDAEGRAKAAQVVGGRKLSVRRRGQVKAVARFDPGARRHAGDIASRPKGPPHKALARILVATPGDEPRYPGFGADTGDLPRKWALCGTAALMQARSGRAYLPLTASRPAPRVVLP